VLIAVILALAVGTYLFRVTGVVLRERLRLPDRVRLVLPIAATVLLTALAATAALTEGARAAGFARPAGVLVGLVLAWRRAPFVLVIVAAAGTAAVLRLLGVP
jgi:branched-subunit amino acid transport protein